MYNKHNNQKLNPKLLKNPVYCLALGFGTGLAGKAPGTVGTLVGIPLFLLMQPFSVLLYCVVTLILFVAGIWICGHTTEKLGVHDHPGIVWDEVVGYLVTMIMVPADWIWIIIGFILFRIFDILKPWPIKSVDRQISGGFGIMLDDLIAGLFAFISMKILMQTFGS